MVKTISIGCGKEYNAYRNAGYTHMEAITFCVAEDVAKAFKEANCLWVTNVTSDKELVTISASSTYAFPGESKPSIICAYVVPLNETDEDYCALREAGLSEAEIRDELLNTVEADASCYGTIKAWHVAYVPGCAVVFASI